MGGFRTTDTNGGGSGSNGACIVAHYGARYIDLFNNIYFNSNRGIAIADAGGATYTVDSFTVQNEIFHNIGYEDSEEHVFVIIETKRMLVDACIMRDTADQTMSDWMWTTATNTDLTITNNVLINKGVFDTDRTSTTTSDNWFYNTPRDIAGDGTVYGTEAEANMKDTSFNIDKYIYNFYIEILNNVVTTTTSPHY